MYSCDFYSIVVHNTKIIATEECGERKIYCGNFVHQGEEDWDYEVLSQIEKAQKLSKELSLSVKEIICHCFENIGNFSARIGNFAWKDAVGLTFIKAGHNGHGYLFDVVLERQETKANLRREITRLLERLEEVESLLESRSH
jgi:hypothetical protein